MPQDLGRTASGPALLDLAAQAGSSPDVDPVAVFDCQSCGACCAYAADWPRFSTEDDAELERIPEVLVAADLSGIRFENGRCAALRGEVGKATACGIYDARPHVCHACMPGDPECLMARAAHGLELPISPLVGEMPGRAEGGAVAPASQPNFSAAQD